MHVGSCVFVHTYTHMLAYDRTFLAGQTKKPDHSSCLHRQVSDSWWGIGIK